MECTSLWMSVDIPLGLCDVWSPLFYGYVIFLAEHSKCNCYQICIFSISCNQNDGAQSANIKICGDTLIFVKCKWMLLWNYTNLSPPSAARMHQWIGSALVKIMACRLFGAKPLSKPMLCYCQLDPFEQTSMKFESKYTFFHSRKCIWKRLQNGGHFGQGEMS